MESAAIRTVKAEARAAERRARAGFIVPSSRLRYPVTLMTLRARRRHHGDGIVAHVEPVLSFWQASVWRIADPDGSVRKSPKLPFPESAEAAADELVRDAFHHLCTIDTCSDWLPWSHETIS